MYSASVIKRLGKVTVFRAVVTVAPVCRVEPTSGLLCDAIMHPAASDASGPAVGSGGGFGDAG